MTVSRKTVLPPIDAFKGENSFLSNFFLVPIEFENHVYRSVEHAYQAAKTKDPWERAFIRECQTPGLAKKRGKSVKLREGWDKKKDQVMLGLLRRKFFTFKDLGDKLLDTGDAELIEGNYWGDCYWGVYNGKGENKLGKLLMQVREELRKRRG